MKSSRSNRRFSKNELIDMATAQKQAAMNQQALNMAMGQRMDLIAGLVKEARLPWWETKGRKLVREIAEVLVIPV